MKLNGVWDTVRGKVGREVEWVKIGREALVQAPGRAPRDGRGEVRSRDLDDEERGFVCGS